MIERSLVEQPSLSPIGHVEVHAASTGRLPIHPPVYSAQLLFAGLADGVLVAELKVGSAEDLEGLGVQILLGRNLLDRCLFFLNGPGRRFPPAFWSTDVKLRNRRGNTALGLKLGPRWGTMEGSGNTRSRRATPLASDGARCPWTG